jgi:preprotein translocase subunit SecA
MYGFTHADIRRQLWEYDQVLNTQRDKVYLERRKVLQASDLSALMLEYAERTVDDIVQVLPGSRLKQSSFRFLLSFVVFIIRIGIVEGLVTNHEEQQLPHHNVLKDMTSQVTTL